MNSDQIIDEFGGTQKVADMFDITTGAVSQWRHKGIPKARMVSFKLAKPSLFGIRKSKSAK